MKKRTKIPLSTRKKRIAITLIILMAISIVYAVVRWLTTPEDYIPDVAGMRTRADYGLMVLQCVLGMVVVFIPGFIEKRLKIDIPDALELLYFVFLFCAVYLGEVRDFYHRIPFWDNILHTMSGGMLAVVGFYVVYVLNKWDKLQVDLSPFFVAFFAFCFAVACGVVWEIYEFTVDSLFKMNMQKYLTGTGEALVGAAALHDTMIDLVLDTLSALAVATAGFFSIRKEKVLQTEKQKKAVEKASKTN